METFSCAPERGGPYPAVLFLMDAHGIREELRDMARRLAPLPMVEELRGWFKQVGVAGEIEMYPEVHHGFAFPQRWCYDKPAAERHWERLLALYRCRLPAR
jgi:dienelactone hydrolase